MQTETTAVAAKVAATAATAASAAFGMTWWAVAAALLGAVASLHWEAPAAGSAVWRVALQIFALGFLAAMVAVAAPHITGFAWTQPEGLSPDVSLVVRAGLLGIFANPISNLVRAAIAKLTRQQGA